MAMKKKVLAMLVICFMMAAAVFPLSSYAAESTGNATFDAFISEELYKHDASWGNRRPAISSYDSGSCAAYTADFVKYCYGKDNPCSGTAYYDVNAVQAGDVIILGNRGDGTGHWLVCLKRNGNSLYTAEGNISGKVRVGWCYTISGDRFAEDGRYFNVGYHHGTPMYVDKTGPTISEITVTDRSSSGYRVRCKVTDESGVASVKFNTDEVGGTYNSLNQKAGVKDGDYWYIDVTGLYRQGEYETKIYATDNNGNTSTAGSGAVLADQFAPKISNVSVSDVKAGGFTVTCTASDNDSISKVMFAVFEASQGYQGETLYKGAYNGSAWTYTFSGLDKGKTYCCQVYAYDMCGNRTGTTSEEVGPGDDIPPVIESLTLVSTTDTEAVIEAVVSDNTSVDHEDYSYTNRMKLEDGRELVCKPGTSFEWVSDNRLRIRVSSYISTEQYSLTLKVSDTAGNQSEAKKVYYELKAGQYIYLAPGETFSADLFDIEQVPEERRSNYVFKPQYFEDLSCYGDVLVNNGDGTFTAQAEGRSNLVFINNSFGYYVGALVVVEDPAPKITAQPVNVKTAVGSTAKFAVTASGSDLSYQWQYRTGSTGKWAKATANGNRTANLNVPATTGRNGYQYRCVVKNSLGTVYSKAATLTVTDVKPAITGQPSAVSAAVGSTAKFTVSASGNNLSYQWQYRTGSTGKWAKATANGNQTANLNVPATTGRNGYQYRCVVKNSGGTVYSKAATLTVTAAKPVITTQPANVVTAEGSPAVFKVRASGSDLSYQWQYRTAASGTWAKATANGNQTATLTVPGTGGRNGYQYRCVVKNSGGTVYSKAATLTVTVTVKAEPEETEQAETEQESLETEAEETGLETMETDS